MSRIKIKNFGPIKEGLANDAFIDIKKVTVFIGNQGSGKSTVAKLISTFSWMEKALLNGTLSGMDKDNFVNERCSYFRLLKYFRPETEILFEGDYCDIKYFNENITVGYKIPEDRYVIPKIMYVPAERSFLSSVEDAENVSGLPKPLFEFMYENNRSLKELHSILPLPIGNYRLRYDSAKRVSYILGDDYELELTAASSGLHSVVPLYVVSRDIADAIATGKTDKSISPLNYRQEQKKKAELREISIDSVLEDQVDDELRKKEQFIESKYRNSSFLNIVEEPEQNLFPTSQKEILFSLLEFNNKMLGNKLIMTTHSPYLLVYLTLCVEADRIKQKANTDEIKSRLNEIVPLSSTLDGHDLVVYQLDELDGSIQKLKDYKGLPSDENRLNQGLIDSNEDFSKLLDLEDLCQ